MNIYYFAYGTNLNKKIFLKRFKNAKLIEKYTLKNYKVVFRTKYIIPDLQRKIKSKVQGLIYKIDKNIEKKLDIYEEYPKLYIKKYFKYKEKKIISIVSKQHFKLIVVHRKKNFSQYLRQHLFINYLYDS